MMDDLQMVRDLLPHTPPPTPEVTAAARARIMSAVAGQEPAHSLLRRTGLRQAIASRWRLAAPALAAVTAAAVTATLLASGSPGAPTPAKLTAREFLLAAASAAVAAPSTGTGKYLVQTSVMGELMAAGPNSHPYVIERRSGVSASWWPTSPGPSALYVSGSYASRLPTPGAVAAWRADGSPPLPRQSGPESRLRSSVSVSVEGRTSPVPTILTFGNEDLTLAQFRALPSSAAGLKEAIVKSLHAFPGAPGEIAQGNQGIIDVCADLLSQDPITPAVRAAAFRILAAMPGMSLNGQVTDPLGRVGYSITLPGPGWQGLTPTGAVAVLPAELVSVPTQVRLIISSSGTVLAREWVSTAPTTNLVAVMPASGAIPSPTSCPAGDAQSQNFCWPKVPTSYAKDITLGDPILAVPAGTVVGYQAYLSSGLTNATPSATIPSLLPLAAASSSPSASSPSQSPSPATSSLVTVGATPSQFPSASSPAPSQSASTPVPTQSPSKT